MKLHDIIANYCVIAISEQAVLAKSLYPNAPEPYVCWHHDADGDGVHTGQYFVDKEDAEWCFAARSFEWFEGNAHIEMIEDKTEAESLIKQGYPSIQIICTDEDTVVFNNGIQTEYKNFTIQKSKSTPLTVMFNLDED